MSKSEINFELKDECVHFYIVGSYLGMLTFDGQLSNFRATICKAGLNLESQSFVKSVKLSLFEMLNFYLRESFFIEDSNIQAIKESIVRYNQALPQKIYEAHAKSKNS